MKTIISIEGMCCEKCAKRAENALSTVKGAVNCDVKFKKKMAVIRSREPLSEVEIKNVISEAGFTVTAIEVK